MQTQNKPKMPTRCAYIKVCYMAEELRCFGYKTDCPLYLRSNNEYCSEENFNRAMDELIDKTRLKYEKLLK